MMTPGLDGVRTTRVLRSLSPGLKIIGSSGLISNEPARGAGVIVPDGFIAKPYTAETLLKSVLAVIRAPARL